MQIGFWTFVLVAVVVSTVATILNNWIKARHGYPIEDGGSARDHELEQVCAENRDLQERVSRLESRLEVMERIATDPAEKISREISRLS